MFKVEHFLRTFLLLIDMGMAVGFYIIIVEPQGLNADMHLWCLYHLVTSMKLVAMNFNFILYCLGLLIHYTMICYFNTR